MYAVSNNSENSIIQIDVIDILRGFPTRHRVRRTVPRELECQAVFGTSIPKETRITFESLQEIDIFINMLRELKEVADV